jgi:putative Mn2+ efflux pump MntP
MIVSTAAIVSGKRATAVLGARAQIVGAAVLLIIALKIVISHTT